jgi:hypothetical protein
LRTLSGPCSDRTCWPSKTASVPGFAGLAKREELNLERIIG